MTPVKIREIRSIFAIEDKNERNKRLREFKSGVSVISVEPEQRGGVQVESNNTNANTVDVSLMAIVI